MAVVSRGTTPFSKFRLLISGQSNTGKTSSISTFLYGSHDYWDEGEQSKAVAYAGNKTLVTIVCPGEVGTRSLSPDTPQMTSYYFEFDGSAALSGTQSAELLHDFNVLYIEVVKNKPDVLFIDGIHHIHYHYMNKITDGQYFVGEDLNVNPQGRSDPYRSARFYSQAHMSFGNYLSQLYSSPIPFIGVTARESWQAARTDMDRPGGIQDTRYLWPDLPGEMATRIVGNFDARISAQISTTCLHRDCSDSKKHAEHYTWQFLPKNDVRGVGIKGLRVSDSMKAKPFIHQNASHLMTLIHKAT